MFPGFFDYALFGSSELSFQSQTPEFEQSAQGIAAYFYLIFVKERLFYPLHAVSAVFGDHSLYFSLKMLKLLSKSLVRMFVVIVGIFG